MSEIYKNLGNIQLPARSKLAVAIGIASSILFAIDAAADSAGGALEEVIVTANKKEQSISDVSSAVNVVTGAQLEKFQLFQFEDVKALSPGLDLSKATERSFAVTLRGAPFDPDSGAAPTATTYWNGIAVRPPVAFQQLFDIDRIEVLHGAQGTLQGETSPSGAITIYTKQANVNNTDGYLRQTFVNDGGSVSELAAGMPIIEGKLGVRVAGVYNEDYNDKKSLFTGQEGFSRKKGGRVNFYATPTDNLDASLTYENMESKDDTLEVVEGKSLLNNGNPPLSAKQQKSLQEANSNFYRRHELLGLTINYEILDNVFTFVGSHGNALELPISDSDIGNIFPNQVLAASFGSNVETKTYEFRVTNSENSFWEYIVGAYYSDEDVSAPHLAFDTPSVFSYAPASGTPPIVGMPGVPDLGYLKGDINDSVQTKSLAGFMNNDFHLTDDLTFTVGARWQKYKQERDVIISTAQDFNVGTVIPAGTVLQTLPDAYKKTDEVARSGIAKLSYHFTPALMVYGSYARSFRPGGSAIVVQVGVDPNLIVYKSESSNSFEVGFKQFSEDGRYQLTGATYYQKFNNFIQRNNGTLLDLNGDGILDTSIGGININNNAIIRGLELEGSVVLTPEWSASLSFAYTDAKYDHGAVPCGRAGDAADPGSQVRTCKTNGRLGDAPLWNATANTEYAIPNMLMDNDGYVRALYTYTGERVNDQAPFNPQLYSAYRLPGYSVFDLYIGLRSPDKKWDVSVWAKNLFDVAATRAIGGDVGLSGANVGGGANTLDSGYSSVVKIPERSMGVTANWRFGG